MLFRFTALQAPPNPERRAELDITAMDPDLLLNSAEKRETPADFPSGRNEMREKVASRKGAATVDNQLHTFNSIGSTITEAMAGLKDLASVITHGRNGTDKCLPDDVQHLLDFHEKASSDRVKGVIAKRLYEVVMAIENIPKRSQCLLAFLGIDVANEELKADAEMSLLECNNIALPGVGEYADE